MLAAFTEAVGEHTPRRTGAEDDVVVFIVHARSIATDFLKVKR
jgi:hypothetical protein